MVTQYRNNTISSNNSSSIDIPNRETQEDLAEYGDMQKNPTHCPRYNSFAELLTEILLNHKNNYDTSVP